MENLTDDRQQRNDINTLFSKIRKLEKEIKSLKQNKQDNTGKTTLTKNNDGTYTATMNLPNSQPFLGGLSYIVEIPK